MSFELPDLSVRVTASLTKEQDRVLRALAAKHKVSVAWLIRYAVSQLVEQADTVQLPLDLIRRP
ncbi:MAG: ribbon-helix-helix domain-containing protein [Alphaproteobacteria bacterium]